MRLKNLLCASLAVALTLTSVSMPVSAALDPVEAPDPDSSLTDTYLQDAQNLILDVVKTSLTGIESSTMDDAIVYIKNKITVDDIEVSYDGNIIGYIGNNVMYTDAYKGGEVIKKTSSGYTVSPMLLKTILADVNSKLIETITPKTDDWSKIIGKYDVTLGDITIPASNWVELPVSTEPLMDGEVCNISRALNIHASDLGGLGSGNDIVYFSWLVDADGKLYVQEQIVDIYKCRDYQGTSDVIARYTSTSSNYSDAGYVGAGTRIDRWDGMATRADSTYLLSVGVTSPSDTTLFAKMYAHEVVPNISGATYTINVAHDEAASTLRDITTPTNAYTGTMDSAKKYGVVWALTKDIGLVGQNAAGIHAEHLKFFTKDCSSSLKILGNSKLKSRINKLSDLSSTDTLAITSDGWLINGTTNIDTYLGSQNMSNAGDSAEISAVADVEPLSFNVVVPTTLPIYIDAAGTVSVASNATITNKSNAAVQIKEIDIAAKDTSGWTLVKSDPSPTRDAMEFSFTTSLVEDTVLAKDEEIPFTYTPKLSPLTTGADALDLATVTVTVDWAD